MLFSFTSLLAIPSPKDNMVITATIQLSLQNTMENLATCTNNNNEQTINSSNTKIIKFRKEHRRYLQWW
jgi:hypothetical protein